MEMKRVRCDPEFLAGAIERNAGPDDGTGVD
jgi:hypothetical protein